MEPKSIYFLDCARTVTAAAVITIMLSVFKNVPGIIAVGLRIIL